MTDKFHSDTQEKIETITYQPGVKTTDDLEEETGTITATSEASGVENADYSHALTLPAPDDARLIIIRIAARLSVTIDSFDTTEHLYCRVYVDQQDADHRLFDMDWNSTGSKITASDTYIGNKEAIFELLRDGSSHTFYFFFWIDKANNAVISLVQLWEAVGSCSNANYPYTPCLEIVHQGHMSLISQIRIAGSGTPTGYLCINSTDCDPWLATASGDYARFGANSYLAHNSAIWVKGSINTDLNYLNRIYINLRNVK